MPEPFALPKIIAHRGASTLAPENTLSAFKIAKNRGATWVEFDVQLTHDGVPVVLHDNTLDRTTNGHGFIYQRPFAEVAQLDAGSWFSSEFSGEGIPTLEATLKFLIANNLHANIEIKDSPDVQQNIKTAQVVAEILKTLPQHPYHFLLSSFCFHALQALRQALPDAALGMLLDITNWKLDWQNRYAEIQNLFQKLHCSSLNVNQRILTQKRIQQIQTISQQILVYTVNDVATAKMLFELGITGIFSDQLTINDLN